MKTKKPLLKAKYRHICFLVFVIFIFGGFNTVIFSRENDPLTPEERTWLTQHDGKIVLGHDPSARPIDFYDEQGNFRGLAADYVGLLEKKLDKELELIVMDDGVGIPDGLDWKNSKSLGLKLVRTLVENQLDGSIDMESNNGTKFIIKFNIET